MKLKFIAAAFALGFGLAGCQAIQTAETLSATTVPANQAVAVAQTYDALVRVGTFYDGLPPCPTAAICRAPAGVTAFAHAVYSGRAARKQLVSYILSGSAAPVSLINILDAAITAAQSAAQQYNIPMGS